MNFFEHQQQARRNTGLLILLFIAAVFALIVLTNLLVMVFISVINGANYSQNAGFFQQFSPSLFLQISVGVVLVVFAASLFKLMQLSSGGKAVAEALGGHRLYADKANRHEKRLLNVVEEMAIAAGVPVPPVYLLEEEGINAFAAGYDIRDAVIGVTRGCMQHLSRDELQGVVAHEFSHIFNGDMRLNLRLIAILSGILIIGNTGSFILRSGAHSGYRVRSGKSNSNLPILVLGLGLVIIGFAGVFFGNVIKAAVSRQREFLADASAVQFTRNPEGIANALKRIGGYTAGTKLQHPGSAEFSHLFFGQAIPFRFSGLMATHPPLNERISRIEPRWRGEFLQAAAEDDFDESMAQTAGFAPSSAAMESVISGQDFVESVGDIEPETLQYAHGYIDGVPQMLCDSAHEPYGARAVVYCLLMAESDSTLRQKQLRELKRLADSVVFGFTTELLLQFDHFDVAQKRLPLLEICLPALSDLTEEQYSVFQQCMQLLIDCDERVELHEWVIFQIVTHYLAKKSLGHSYAKQINSLQLTGRACAVLLSALAYSGSDNESDALDSFNQAKKILGLRLQYIPYAHHRAQDLSRAVLVLRRLKPLLKPRLIKACLNCVQHDGVIIASEMELLRAISLTLDCPIPIKQS